MVYQINVNSTFQQYITLVVKIKAGNAKADNKYENVVQEGQMGSRMKERKKKRKKNNLFDTKTNTMSSKQKGRTYLQYRF